ncbi:MAG: methyltransferase domain-containing protein [Acidobacteria bacterium]|nr:methyltransferase domain-containing protein [Acidobacteriota bacterium]
MSTRDYSAQRRGDAAAYDRYLRGMDASMKQKIALTAAHLLSSGRVADMGMGSGSGSEALAALYPSLDVVGVDINPTMVELAAKKYTLPNLSFITGDIASQCFDEASLDGVFDSSVLHHVTTFNGYDHEAAARTLEVQVRQLRDYGVLVVRDFVDPGDQDVLLDVRDDDGDASEDPASCSTASLLRRFSREFRKLAEPPESPGFALAEAEPSSAPPPLPGFRRFELTFKLAAEFILRKDYRTDWETEVLEEYTYFTQREFEAICGRLGLRLLASTPIRNPWIVRNRFEGRVEVKDRDGRPLDFPPTNYLIAGEKVPAGEGVRFEDGGPAEPLGFLTMEHFANTTTGRVMDLVARPNPTIDAIPWFREGDDIAVLARRSYPRPILQSAPRGTPRIDGARPADYVTEPLTLIQEDAPLGESVERALARLAGIEESQIVSMERGGVYYPSPGGIREEVRSVFIEISPVVVHRPHASISGFSTSGIVRAIDARQLLRAAQVGGLPDARLESNVHTLLTRLGIPHGDWIGEAIALHSAPRPEVTSIDTLRHRPPRRLFSRAPASASTRFLAIECSQFRELDVSGATIAEKALELVVPRTLGANSVATALLSRSGDDVFIALDDDDLPAAQAFNGNSALLVAPAWRLPRDVMSLRAMRAWTIDRIEIEYGLRAISLWELGGRYHPTPGLTPEAVYPLAIEVEPAREASPSLHWVDLRALIAAEEMMLDGHLRVVAFRAAHALGLLGGSATV